MLLYLHETFGGTQVQIGPITNNIKDHYLRLDQNEMEYKRVYKIKIFYPTQTV